VGNPSCSRIAPLLLPSRRHQHTATGPPLLIEHVTVTLPIHPLKGVALPVARFIRSQDGRRYVDVEHPPGQYMRLPLEWTDRSPPLVPPSVGGREVRLSIPALLKLAQAVQAALEQRRGSSVVPTLAASPTLRPARSTSSWPFLCASLRSFLIRSMSVPDFTPMFPLVPRCPPSWCRKKPERPPKRLSHLPDRSSFSHQPPTPHPLLSERDRLLERGMEDHDDERRSHPPNAQTSALTERRAFPA
jgi:hypothetical protein